MELMTSSQITLILCRSQGCVCVALGLLQCLYKIGVISFLLILHPLSCIQILIYAAHLL